ncbi:hypothetical protein [Stenotrophomonas tumulicola]|uniref:Uncharacterized protein n=1 Tax=Stenotrophomonas tumulicola TaxID=1685415 RepID=A0A7W3FP17_9GAMM|nr:hypothetical protein [Stenotrophomonas tumulicola]MBA8683111.1 hypothetical protein [Stenotrophomonas tumulicola]
MIDFGLFRSISVPGILRSSGLGRVELKAWVAQGHYKVSAISSGSQDLVFHVVDVLPLIESFGYDHSRFACAAFESARELRADPSFPKATAWAAIRMYYAAFFAAHALLRYSGNACSQIDPEQASLVSKYAGLYGVTENMGKGFYQINWSPVSNDLVMEKVKDSHRDTWRVFDQWLQRAITVLPTVQGLTHSKVEVIETLSALRENLRSEGANSGNWLSAFRNNVNYRQSYDAWYPYRKSAVRFDRISRYIDGWKDSAFNVQAALGEIDDRAKFFGSCAVIMHLLNGITIDLLKAAQKNSLHSSQTARLVR